MGSGQAILLLLYFLGGLLLGLLSWGWWRIRRPEINAAQWDRGDNLFLLWLSALAVFALGVFLTYIFLSFRF